MLVASRGCLYRLRKRFPLWKLLPSRDGCIASSLNFPSIIFERPAALSFRRLLCSPEPGCICKETISFSSSSITDHIYIHVCISSFLFDMSRYSFYWLLFDWFSSPVIALLPSYFPDMTNARIWLHFAGFLLSPYQCSIMASAFRYKSIKSLLVVFSFLQRSWLRDKKEEKLHAADRTRMVLFPICHFHGSRAQKLWPPHASL